MLKLQHSVAIMIASFILASSCSSSDKTTKRKLREPTRSASSGKSKASKKAFVEGVKLSSSYKSFTTSASNSSKTSKRVNREKLAITLEKLRADVQGSSGKTKLKKAEDYLAVQAMLGADYTSAYTMSRVFIDESRKLNGSKSKTTTVNIKEREKLNLAASLIRRKNTTGATFLIEQLVNSKDKEISASAYNMLGVISIMMNRNNLAAADFKTALSKKSSHEAARLNLGYLSLKYGKYSDAKKYLTGFSKDWYAVLGLAVASYQMGDYKGSQRYCDQALKLNPKSKSLYFNCGLQDYYITGDTKKVRTFFDRATKIPGSTADASIDEKIYLVQGQIEEEIVKNQEKKEMDRLRKAELVQQKKLLDAEKKAKQELIRKEKAAQDAKSPSVDDLL